MPARVLCSTSTRAHSPAPALTQTPIVLYLLRDYLFSEEPTLLRDTQTTAAHSSPIRAPGESRRGQYAIATLELAAADEADLDEADLDEACMVDDVIEPERNGVLASAAGVPGGMSCSNQVEHEPSQPILQPNTSYELTAEPEG